MSSRIHPFLWLGLPILFMVFSILCELFLPDHFKPAFFSEEGPHEKLQALIMAIAVIVAMRLTFAVKGKWLKIWFGIAALASFYIAGEEISWGQSYEHWATPAYWASVNDQDETNLHNTSTWLDQKPRALLEIGVIVGGLLIPALQRWKPSILPAKFASIYPTYQTSLTAGFVLLLKTISFYQKVSHHHLFWRISEVNELFMYFFVLVYLLEMTRRFKLPVPEPMSPSLCG